MLSILLKLLPVAAIGAGVMNGKEVGKDALSAITDMVYVNQMKGRLNIINTALLSDLLADQKNFPKDFIAYVREVCKVKGGDCAIDPWESKVQLFVDPQGAYYEILSLGPDKEAETDDDIFIQTELRN